MSDGRVTGGCLCGAVRFEGTLSDRGVGACYCKQCRQFASGAFHATRFAGGVGLTEARGLKWFESSAWGKRGFCCACGSSLFWSMADAAEGDWAVSAGALDGDPEQRFYEHIFWDRRPGYIDGADAAPKVAEAEIWAKYGRPSAAAKPGAASEDSA